LNRRFPTPCGTFRDEKTDFRKQHRLQLASFLQAVAASVNPSKDMIALQTRFEQDMADLSTMAFA
jgi:hypothetical protein